MNRLVAVGNYFGAHNPFENLFKETVVLKPGLSGIKFKKDDVVLFGGGEDISPTLYNQKPSRYSGSGKLISNRDAYEVEIFKSAVAAGASILGICRGAQLICALSGGSLYQHVNAHAGRDHKMTTSEGTVLNVCSVHHQMMNPMGTKHELLGWSTDILSNVHIIEEEENVPVEVEPEVVFFNDTKALAIQYHPEFMASNDEAVEYARKLVTKYLA